MKRAFLILLAIVCFVQPAGGTNWLKGLFDKDCERGTSAIFRGDYTTAFKELGPLAEKGNAVAQLHLGDMYLNGQGVPQNSAEALKWYRKSAENGNPAASNYLGRMYYHGHGVEQSYSEAAKWYERAADQGGEGALTELGLMYYKGQGVRQSYREAAKWYQMAAKAGSPLAQYNLGVMYLDGRGITQDYIQAHALFNLASITDAAHIAKPASAARAAVAAKMTPWQIAEAQRLAANFKPVEDSDTAPAPRSADSSSHKLKGTGTGFVVSEQGHVITNLHVVKGAKVIRVAGQEQPLKLLATDPPNDLALLKLPAGSYKPARFRSGPSLRPGENVVIVGFPLQGLLTTAPTVTTGTLSALAGPGDNRGLLQLTAPVQAGNSGSPLLDEGGNVIGVVVGKLDVLKVAKATGDLPQNVNFAIHGAMARAFLETHGVAVQTGSTGAALKAADVAEQAGRSVVLIGCFE